MSGFAWVTLATNDSYSLGALVLANSLKRVRTKYDLAVLITPGVTSSMREKLASIFNVVKEVNVLDSQDEANLALLARPELGITFTKLHCWRLTQYDKCVFIDADTLVIRNCDELFEREELSAAPDVGWPDCFNSGVFVYRPSQQTFASLLTFAANKGSFDGGDQGLLNLYFSDWAHKDISKHLPFIYNMCSTASYSYLPAYKQFGDDVRIIHFIGSTKPWLQYFDSQTSQVHPTSDSNHLQPLLQLWWNIFCESVHPQLSPVMASSTLATFWHDSFPHVVSTAQSTARSTNHIYHDLTDFTIDEVDRKITPDFSHFIDPWDDYVEAINNETQSFTPEQQQQQLQQNDQLITHTNCNINLNNETVNLTNENDGKYSDNENFDLANELNYSVINKNESVSCSFLNELTTNLINEILLDNINDKYELNSVNDNNSSIEFDVTDGDVNKLELLNDRLIDNNCLITENDSRQCDLENKIHLNTYSDTSITISTLSETHYPDDEVENTCAGIAGALAKMILGEAKSSEQIAYEEHMRKQSWEQGLIDYMGRDSFDNIWKKICTTLSISEEKQEEVQPKVEETAAGLPGDEKKEIQSDIKNDPILAITSGPAVLSIKESGEKHQNVPLKLLKRKSEEEKLDLPNVIPLGFTPEDAACTLTSPTCPLESTIPIQIAESVLEDVKPVKEEAISSVSAMTQESISASVEKPLEPSPSGLAIEASKPSQPNGNLLDGDKAQEKPPVPSSTPLQSSTTQMECKLKPSEKEKVTSVKVKEEKKDLKGKEACEVPIQTGESSKVEAVETPLQPEDSTKTVPEKPVRLGKEIKVPGTPVVTEATPPTSPPIECAQALKKTVKKGSPKKSSSEEKSEGSDKPETEEGKKTTKKVGKKVVKKGKESQDEDPDSASQSTSTEKPKKIVKVTKKSKSSQALDADTPVPDTPPPPTSQTPVEIPVPPKRKVKSTSKSTKKTDEP